MSSLADTAGSTQNPAFEGLGTCPDVFGNNLFPVVDCSICIVWDPPSAYSLKWCSHVPRESRAGGSSFLSGNRSHWTDAELPGVRRRTHRHLSPDRATPFCQVET